MRTAVTVMVIALGMSGCSAALRWEEPFPKSGVYTVEKGDSLYAIALRFDLSAVELARWNGLGDGDLIHPGQTLRLTAPGNVARKPPPRVAATGSKEANSASIAWLWPATGRLAARFGARAGVGKGIDISGKEGDAIFAAAPGKVVYSGGGLIGYGNLIIVKHNRSVLSAYGYNRELLVGEGDIVSAGQRIASMGLGPARRPLLHYEIRVDGQPADPLEFLPAQR